MTEMLRLVRIKRTGGPVFQWDTPLDRGIDFETGDIRAVTETTSTQLLLEDGWELAPPADDVPFTPEE